jgi:hypothetical protein
LRVLKRVRVKFMGMEAECTALFNTGSWVTVIQRSFFERNFGSSWYTLERPLRLYWVNGEHVEADKYTRVTIVIDGFNLPETVFILDDFIEEIEVEGRKVKLPELIIGSSTMDKYGIVLDPREGVRLTGSTLLL